MGNGWTPERRERQAALIRSWKPWEHSTGPRTDDTYPVLSGLNEGDKVAVRGTFLLDSQSQIRGLPSLFYKEGQTAVSGHQHGGASSPPQAVEGGSTPPSGHDQHNR